jgi:hypothetical protein
MPERASHHQMPGCKLQLLGTSSIAWDASDIPNLGGVKKHQFGLLGLGLGLGPCQAWACGLKA